MAEGIEVKFKYTKSNQARNIHVDGVFGGIGPGGLIRMAIWNERPHFPSEANVTVDTVNEQMSESLEIEPGFMREIEAVLFFDLNLAISIRDWLDGHIETVQSNIQQSGNQGERDE